MSDDLLMQNAFGNGFGTLMNVALLVENGCEESLARRVVKQYEDKCSQIAALRLAAQQDGARGAAIEECAKIAKAHAVWAESKIDSDDSIFGAISNTGDDIAEMLLLLKTSDADDLIKRHPHMLDGDHLSGDEQRE